MKQETLEEFIERDGYPEGHTQDIWETGVRDGIAWQQERMYTEEEVLELLEDFEKERSTKVIFAKQWFNKFKK